nr:hypothetical protein [Tanacetum cinerariifolium]
VDNSVFDMEEDILFLERLLSEEPYPIPPMISNQAKSSIEEPEHSFSIGYDHFSTTLVTELNEVEESSIKNLVPIPHECEDNDSQREEINIVTNTDDVLPPRFKNDDSEGEIDVVEELHVDNSISNSENELSDNEASDF